MVKKLPTIIDKEDFEKLFSAVQKSKHKNRKELMLAMLLGFEGGLRISEIVGLDKKIPPLNKNQIDNNSIRIISGKGKKDRVVPRPKRMTESSIKLLPIKLPRRTLQRYVSDLGLKVLKKDISFHTLRHGFGSTLAGAGRPLHEIQMLMGHSRMDTTGIYLHANPKQAVEGALDVF